MKIPDTVIDNVDYVVYKDNSPAPRQTTCLDCHCCMTWAAQRKQFGRAIKKFGFTVDEAKTLMPRCQKCLTSKLKGEK
jgi:hypothetical protein